MRPTRRKSLVLAFLIVATWLVACTTSSGGGPGGSPSTPVPAELARMWYTGSVSPVNFYNPNTGHWANPSGEGLMFTFSPKGNYTNGFLAQSSLYGCSVTFMVYLEGSVMVEGSSLTLYPTWGSKKYEAPCAPHLNEDRRLRPDEVASFQGEYLWEIVPDDLNPSLPLLALSDPDGSPWATLRLME